MTSIKVCLKKLFKNNELAIDPLRGSAIKSLILNKKMPRFHGASNTGRN